MLGAVGRNDSEDGEMPTFVAISRADDDDVLIGDVDDANIPAFTHTLMPIDRPLATLSATPRDALMGIDINEPTDTLIDPRLAAPEMKEASQKKWLAPLLLLVAIGAVAGGGIMMLTGSGGLPPLPPLAAAVAGGGSMAEHDLAFLARRWPAGSLAIGAVGAVAAPSVAPSVAPSIEPSSPPPSPSATSRPRPSSVAPTPRASPVEAPVVTEGPDATASIVAKKGADAATAEILIDGRSVGQAPLRLAIRPGRHTFEAKSAAGRTQQTIVLTPGESRRIVLELSH